MTKSKYAGSALEKLFKKDCSDKSKIIDSSDEYDWYSLTVGWAIGRGLKPREAQNFALYIRYHTDLG